MKVRDPGFAWLVGGWREAMFYDCELHWVELWQEIFGARLLASDLGLDDLWDDLTTASDLAHAHALACRARQHGEGGRS